MRNGLKKDLKEAFEIIKNENTNKDKYSKYSKLYMFTTENIKEYYKCMDFEGKSVLVVCSSGDHVLNAVLRGACDIDAFDCNNLSYYILQLKIASLKVLDKCTFIKYFKNSFDYDTFKKISKSLDIMSYLFWNQLYKYFDYNGFKLKRSSLFVNKYEDIKYNDYIYNYEILKERIHKVKISFSCTNLLSLHSGKYDLIILSNISDYISKLFDNTEKYKDFIEKKLSKRLKPNGEAQVAYIYDYENEYKDKVDLNNKDIRERLFNEYVVKVFESVMDKSKLDAVLMYKRY